MLETHLIDFVPHAIFYKDKRLRFVTANSVFLQAAGLSNRMELHGKDDFDMPWGKMFAKQYRFDDKIILQGQSKLRYLEYQMQATGHIVQVMVSKKPIMDHNNNIIGIIGIYDLYRTQVAAMLPKQQQQCLALTANGLSAKQIAQHMHLSVRTIEYYLQILKRKLACRNKLELIKKAYATDLLINHSDH
jgi:DNA-binding CsgD family transcriptional regulator